MSFNKKGVGIAIGLLTFIVVKVIFNRIGIENIPAPLILTLFIVSYTMFVAGVNKKKLTEKEKVYFLLCASLIAISILSCIVIVILMSYFQQVLIKHSIILLILAALAMISLVGAASIAAIVKKGQS
jgi:hypothetical protein